MKDKIEKKKIKVKTCGLEAAHASGFIYYFFVFHGADYIFKKQ